MAWSIGINVTTHERGYAIVVGDVFDSKVIEDPYVSKEDLLLNLTDEAITDLIEEYVETKNNTTEHGNVEVQDVCLRVNDTCVTTDGIDFNESGRYWLHMNERRRVLLNDLINDL